VACDRTTFERTPKPSAWHWGEIARTGVVPPVSPGVAL
jgi:hypothetical protein